MTDVKIQNTRLPRILTRFPTLWLGLAMIAVILFMSFTKGQLGNIGRDSDDVMRLVQIRDILGGQGWFDTNQHRLGLAGGTDMHWSRIPDIPLILLTVIFDIFTNTENALQWAYAIWPHQSALILVFAMAKGAQFWVHMNPSNVAETQRKPNKTYVFTMALLAFFILNFNRFTPGAIDHHNIQMGLVALAMIFALDPKFQFRTFMFSGFAVAGSLAIGVEVYIFAALICTFVALNWLFKSGTVARGTEGFGLGLAGGLALAFLTTIAPSNYGVVACDALSLVTLCAGVVGGLGLAIAARVLPHQSFKVRMIGLVLLGGVCILMLSRLAPQCLTNPLSDLPDDVNRLWLNEISEAKPLSFSMKNARAEIPYMLGAPLLALAILCRHIWLSREWSSHMLVLMLLVGALGLTVYQQRFSPFAYVIAILPLAGFVANIYQRGAEAVRSHKGDGNKPSNIAYLGSLALSLPLIWAVPGLLLPADSNVTTRNKMAACYSGDVMTALNTLPSGLIAATSNGGAPILQFTQHSAVSGNYHRNIEGITAQIKIATLNPKDAMILLRQNKIDYVHFCNASPETDNLIKENPDGLYGRLQFGETPNGLALAVQPIGEDRAVSIYRVLE